MTGRPVVLRIRETQGGDRRLVESQCGEYLVIDQADGKIQGVQVFARRELRAAVAAFRAEGETHEEGAQNNARGGHRPPHRDSVPALPGYALGL